MPREILIIEVTGAAEHKPGEGYTIPVLTTNGPADLKLPERVARNITGHIAASPPLPVR